MKKYIIIFWVIVLLGLLSFFSMFYLAEKGFLGKMPTIEDLQNPRSDLASEVYSSDGKILGKYFYQNRTNVPFKSIPGCSKKRSSSVEISAFTKCGERSR